MLVYCCFILKWLFQVYDFYVQSTLPEVDIQFSNVNFNGSTFSGSFTLENVGKQTIYEISHFHLISLIVI